MDIIIFRMLGLLVVAIFIAIAARRLRLPYTVGLLVVGIALSFVKFETGITLTHDIIFDVLLPPLIFEAALNIHWRELRRDMVPVLLLAISGVVISGAVIAGGMTAILGWPVYSAIIFGVLIAATDPVAVIAMFKDTGIKGRLRLLVESESLLNDGVAAVLFAIALTLARGAGTHMEMSTFADAAKTLLTVSGGGIVAGLLCGGAAILMAGSTKDHMVETALTVVAAYGSFLLAEHFHMSGVLAAVSAGLLMGNAGILHESDEDEGAKGPVSSQGRAFVLEFWEFAAFIANSIIFLLIGLTVAGMTGHGIGVYAVTVIVALMLAGRALTVYPLCLIMKRAKSAVPMEFQHVLWWGGLRGALSLGLALALPESLAYRDQIVIAAFSVVAFSVVVQGLTMPVLMKRLGLLG